MSRPLRILHLLERLSLGGAGRSLLGLVKHSSGLGIEHTAVSLLPPNTTAREAARAVGLGLHPATDPFSVEPLATADIVQVHFWNAPALYRALGERWPSARVLLWSHVSGEFPPQMLTPDLADFSDALVASCPHTAGLPVFQNAAASRLTATIIDTPDFTELRPGPPEEKSGLTVVYVGTVDFAKMHRDFIRLHTEPAIPGLRVLVAGEGPALPTLRQQAKENGGGERFVFLGQLKSVGPVLNQADIFGYPLAPDGYATSELALQEAMYLGIPPVVLATGGPAGMIDHLRTGLLARDPRDYVAQLARLAGDPGLRHRLGRQASEQARNHWGSDRTAPPMVALYQSLIQRPKRERRPLSPPVPNPSGAACFLQALGGSAPQFQWSLEGQASQHPATVAAADACIADSSDLLASPASGGVLHYRFAYPRDAHLRYWSGLILEKQGRPALAAMEFRQAATLGLVRRRPVPATASAFPSPGNHPVTGVLNEGPTSILYCGNSVSAQRDGYRPILHRWIQDRFQQPHSAVNLCLGGVGSFGAAFFLHRHLDQHPVPGGLCFLECSTGDIGNGATPAEIGPIIEGVVRRLLSATCPVVFLHLYHERQDTESARSVLDIYDRIAAHYRIPSLRPGLEFAQRLRSGMAASSYLLRDRVHTRPAGSFLAAILVARGLEDLDLKPPNVPLRPALFDPRFPYLKMLAPDPHVGPRGTFQFLHPYLEIGPGGGLEVSHEGGEIVGLLFVNGPDAGNLRIEQAGAVRELALHDQWCQYDRLHALRLPAPVPTGQRVCFHPQPTPNAPVSRLRLVALLSRQASPEMIPTYFRVLPA